MWQNILGKFKNHYNMNIDFSFILSFLLYKNECLSLLKRLKKLLRNLNCLFRKKKFCKYFLCKIDFLTYVVELLVWMTAAQFIEHKKSPEYKQVHPTLNNNMISTDYLVNFQIQHYFFSLLVFLKWLLKDDEH